MQENFDLFETTIQLVENRNNAKEQQCASVDVLKNYEGYREKLKENLDELLVSNCENQEILEANKFMKEKFQQDSVNVRSYFHQIFGYIVEINKATQKIDSVRDSISTTYEDNERRLYDLNQSVANSIKESALAAKKKLDVILGGKIELQKEEETIDVNYAIEREDWELLTQQFDQDRECVSRIELECEVLRDRITEDNELYKQECKLSHSKCIKIAQKNTNLRKQLEEIIDCNSNAQTSLNEQWQELTASKHILEEVKHENNITEASVETTNRIFEEKCKEIKTIRDNVKQLWEQISVVKNKQMEHLQKKQNELLFIKKQTDQKSEINEKMIMKFNHVNMENKETTLKLETTILGLNNTIKALEISHEKIQAQKQEIENCIKITQASSSEIKLKISHLETLTNERNQAMFLQQNNKKSLEIEQKNRENKNINIEKKIKKNKELQQSLDDLKQAIDQSTSKIQHLSKERDENAERVKKLKHKCEFLNRELRKREDIAESIKSSKASFDASKKATKEKVYSKQRKRGIDYDSDSSSVDGERLSYAEFMARKTAVQNKKTKRSSHGK